MVGLVILLLGIGIGSGRITIGSATLLDNNKSSTTSQGDLDFSGARQVYDALKENFDGELDETKLRDGIKAGLAEATGDPNTEYLNAEDSKKFEEDLNGTFTGIGAELSKNAKDNLVIVAPIAGFPAERAGLKAKDVIAEIDGQPANDLSVSEAVNKIRGPEGTKVKLRIIRGEAQDLTLEVTRQLITVPSISTEVLDGNIGYLKISRFSEDTSRLALQAAQEFKRANHKGVIVDVRSNPGGLLDAAVDVSSLWLPQDKTVLLEKRRGEIIKTFRSDGTATLQGIPTVVLVDEGSASASEIVAAALRDNGAAKLIGVKTFGKGSVQQTERLSGGGLLKVTVAHWFTPGDKSIDKTGLEPDQKVERSDDDIKNSRDPQKDFARQLLKR